jgi:hypothetical protein
MMRSHRQRKASWSLRESGEQPDASISHSVPTMASTRSEQESGFTGEQRGVNPPVDDGDWQDGFPIRLSSGKRRFEKPSDRWPLAV